jgi:predicted metalloprotease
LKYAGRMLWRGRKESENVEDQRSFGGKSMGIGGLLVGAAIVYLMGGNPLAYLAANLDSAAPRPAAAPQEEADKKSFVSVVLADTEDVWVSLFRREGKNYQRPKLVLFRGRVDSACGRAGSSVGPFYCPADQKVYLDLSFLQDLSQKLGAPGEFAGAYVIAHEVGHHVQNLLNLTGKDRSNLASVKIELQADCLAGVWAKQTQATKNVLEPGDIKIALGAASAVGDDRLQQRSQGYVVPDSFTHGSSEQRMQAFQSGYSGGELAACL